jgi:hypothetical protein
MKTIRRPPQSRETFPLRLTMPEEVLELKTKQFSILLLLLFQVLVEASLFPLPAEGGGCLVEDAEGHSKGGCGCSKTKNKKLSRLAISWGKLYFNNVLDFHSTFILF